MKRSHYFEPMTAVAAFLSILLHTMMFVTSLRRFEQFHRPKIVLQMQHSAKNILHGNQYHQSMGISAASASSISSTIPTISTTRMYCVSNKMGVSDVVTGNNNAVTALEKANAGIRLIKEDNNTLVLWKTSNVAISSSEHLIRPASIPVNDWINIYLPTLRPRVVYPQLLTSSTSGLVLIAKTDDGKDFFRKSAEENRIIVTYEAVLFEKREVNSSNMDNSPDKSSTGNNNEEQITSINLRLERLRKSLDAAMTSNQGYTEKVNFTLLSSTDSGTYVRLHSVAIKVQVPGSDASSSIIPDVIAESLSNSELSCVKDGKTPYVALVNIEIKETEENREVVTTTNQDIGSFFASEKAPSKFMKLMRREEILFGRMRESSLSSSSSSTSSSLDNKIPNGSNTSNIDNNISAENNGSNPQSVETVTFLGLRIMVPHSALRPRDSSGVLVRLAVDEINDIRIIKNRNNIDNEINGNVDNINKRTVRVLDLGCGSGALLLSTLKSHLSTPPLNDVNILGVGVDLDLDALNYASINADYAGISSNCAFIAADFGQLHTEGVKGRLIEAILNIEKRQDNEEGNDNKGGKVVLGGEKLGTNEVGEAEKRQVRGIKTGGGKLNDRVEGEGLFDVILCNPPFLSSKATAGRVTSEGDRCLVGGLTGMEPYIAICKSVALGCGANSSSLSAANNSVSNDSTSSGVSEAPKAVKMRSLLSRIKKKSNTEEGAKEADIKVVETDRASFLSSLPLLSPHGIIIFQVPGGDKGWSDVTRAVEGLGLGFEVTAVKDERGVKRCVVLRRK